VQIKSLYLIGLVGLATTALHAQPTNGAAYWAASPPDCSAISSNQTAVAITNSAGTTIGYSCYMSGTFSWLAAGAGWATAIRVAAPASAPIGVDYTFYDADGNDQSMDVTGSFPTSSNDVNFALYPNQPSEIDLQGLAGTNHSTTATGSVYAIFYCPDQDTCLNVLPQLIYSALPSIAWSLSVPITWDTALSATWSAVGIDNGGSKIVSLVVYNVDLVAHSYSIYVYNSAGTLVGTGVTPLIAPLPILGNGFYGEGGTYGFLLKDVIATPLPTGPFKVLVDGGPNGILSAVVVLQFDGPSGTSLQVAFDSAPGSGSTTAAVQRHSVRKMRAAATARHVFRALPQ